MRKKLGVLLAGTALALLLCGRAQAGFIQNSTGLASPAQTITFAEPGHAFPQLTVITNQYSDLGVTFSPNLYYASQTGGFPNIDDNHLGNFDNLPSITNPFFINFNEVQSEAAFAAVTNSGTSYFTALLNGTPVETFSATTGTSSFNNFYGFTGIQFDTIQVNANPANGFMLIDNLQFSPAVQPAPEPSTYAMFGLGLLAVIVVARKRKLAGREPTPTA